MSCQQASRFITNNINNTINNVSNNISNNCNSLNHNISSISNNSKTVKENRITRVVQQEDPYVFTESVPTTPPILFNTQKTRTRLNDITATTTTLSVGRLQQQQQQYQHKLPLTETNGKITATFPAAASNGLKTQASLLATATNTATTTPTTIFKNVTQSLTTTTTTQLHSATNNNNNNNNKKLTNVCIVRPQLQQQQQPPHQYSHNHLQQQHQIISSSAYEGDLKSISPPPLYTPPTPSLWQTPLLLETTTTVAAAQQTAPSHPSPSIAAPQVANVAPQQSAAATLFQTSSSLTVGCVTPTVQNAVGNTMSLMNSTLTITTAAMTTTTTTAMAKVSPIIVHNTPLTPPSPPLSPALCSSQNLNQCLPPSKFHNHTLAQHLEKVECLKSKKSSQQPAEIESFNDNGKIISISTTSASSHHHQHDHHHHYQIATTPTSAAALQSINCTSSSPLKHSDSEDLNEIPVNVIFRMALVPQPQQHEIMNEKSSSITSPAKNNATTPTTPSTPPPPQIKNNNLNMKTSIPASKTTTTNQIVKQQINTSSIQQQQQQQQNNTTKPVSLKLYQQKQPEQQLQQPEQHFQQQPEQQFQQPPTVKTEIVNSHLETEEEKSLTNSKKLTHTTSSKPCSSRKLQNTISTTTSISKLISDLPYNWQMAGCTTTKGAVAIVKMSQHDLDLDTSPLATAAVLPYCLQQHWFNSYDFHKSSLELMADKPLNRSLAREERIAMYKQQLRREAMQLLSTRSLQKLPLKVARRRLLCVDRLLRKYQQSEKELPANVKRCCFNGCDAYTLEMASHCQQHIVYNAAQHVFLPCTAKFADNTQCRVPVFDINHDLPLCVEHARKRDAYNRLLYEQRPRKISAPTSMMLLNETTTTTVVRATKASTVAAGVSAAAVTGGAGGVVLKAHNYQQQQHPPKQQQQQLPTNNNNKRPAAGAALVNQQARKRKMNMVGTGGVGNPVGRPQKRQKKNVETTNVTTASVNTNHHQQHPHQQMPRLTSTNLKRKSSTTSLESLATTSNSQHSTTSSTSQQHHQQQHHHLQHQQLYGLTSSATTTSSSTPPAATSLAPPALAPLSSGGLMVGHHGLPQHLFSFGHDTHQHHHPNINNNTNEKHSFSSTAAGSVSSTTTTPTELKDFMSQFSFIAHRNQQQQHHLMENTNSNSNFTSSGMGSTTSLPTADDYFTQDMLSICENSSASSADTGLGGLSDPELMLGGPEDDIPLGDTHLLEEHDLANVLNSLPEDAFKELFATVHQDESDEIERAIELADKHLKTLQQTIGSELGDFLDFNDDMLMDNSDMCNASTVTSNNILDTSALFLGGAGIGGAASANVTGLAGGTSVAGGGGSGSLVQT